jgi:hypothetical protein
MKYLRYCDLIADGVIKNRTTLQNWIADRGFPPGRLVDGVTRLWTETEVTAWIKNRSSTTAKRATPRGNWKRGRRRKADHAGVEA